VTKKVLYIEDNADSLEFVRAATIIGGYDFVGAPDGESGLSLAGTQLPDLVLLDISLPDIEGSEVARRLRANFQSLPILALSADTTPEGRNKALAAGCNQYLAKPIDVSELWRVLATYLLA
jgi:two-component system, cell cycle response regulator DivK